MLIKNNRKNFKKNFMIIAELENIGLKIDGQKIIDKISLQLKKGEITTLIGPNGGGKTSIARILLGILKATSGKVIKNSKIKIGYMPQKIEIDKTIPLTAKDFIKLSTHKIFFDEAFKNLIKRLNVEKILKKQIHDLSGGQLQKILFLRALANQPDLLVLDEPTQYMDIAATQDFYQIIEEVRKTNNCAILLISHDLLMVMQKTDIVFCINHHICCHGSPESINQHPEYLSLFGDRSNLGIYQHHHDHAH
jgi:zinc transport system ATP-binding protein